MRPSGVDSVSSRYRFEHDLESQSRSEPCLFPSAIGLRVLESIGTCSQALGTCLSGNASPRNLTRHQTLKTSGLSGGASLLPTWTRGASGRQSMLRPVAYRGSALFRYDLMSVRLYRLVVAKLHCGSRSYVPRICSRKQSSSVLWLRYCM
jgi:hypothetical protein